MPRPEVVLAGGLPLLIEEEGHVVSEVYRIRGSLDIVRRPKTTPIHELERYMRCKDCSDVRGYPYKRSHLVALRPTKISASNPPSTWWPGER
jgi:hypothetical protein